MEQTTIEDLYRKIREANWIAVVIGLGPYTHVTAMAIVACLHFDKPPLAMAAATSALTAE